MESNVNFKGIDSNVYDVIYSTTKKYSLSTRWDETVYKQLYLAVKNLITNKEAMILDMGCGTGQFAQCLFEHGYYNYFGVDFSRIAIDIASKRLISFYEDYTANSPNYMDVAKVIQYKNQFYGETFCIYGNIYKMNNHTFNLEFFDCICMLEVLEHIERDLELMWSIPAGKTIILSVPNFDSNTHVRYFQDLEDVKARYGIYIDIEEAFEIEIETKKTKPVKLFVVKGRKNKVNDDLPF